MAAELLRLGEGAFASVHLTESGLAVKYARKSLLCFLKQSSMALREKQALETAQANGQPSQFLARIRGTAQNDCFLLLYMDAVLAADALAVDLSRLAGAAGAKRQVPATTVTWVASALCSGLAHLHVRGVAHRDVKPQNCVLHADGTPVLVDFGCARILDANERSTSLVGTLPYSAPEMLSRNGHNAAVDWWSLGVLAFELLTGVPPFYGPDTPGSGVANDVPLGCTHAELVDAIKAARTAGGGIIDVRALSSLSMLIAEPGMLPQELEDLLCRLLVYDDHVRMETATQWCAEHTAALVVDDAGALGRETWREGRANAATLLRMAVKQQRDAHNESPGDPNLITEERTLEEAWAAEERAALLARADAAWAKNAESWQAAFTLF